MHDHASAVDVADLQAREFSAAHAGAVEGHQNGAIEGSGGSIDELCYFFLTEDGRQAIALPGIGNVGNAPGLAVAPKRSRPAPHRGGEALPKTCEQEILADEGRCVSLTDGLEDDEECSDAL